MSYSIKKEELMEITEIYTPEELEIYDEGFRSAKKGTKLESNPFDSIDDDRNYSIQNLTGQGLHPEI